MKNFDLKKTVSNVQQMRKYIIYYKILNAFTVKLKGKEFIERKKYLLKDIYKIC